MKKKNQKISFATIFTYLLPFILLIVIIISILLILLSITKKKTAKEIVKEMGIGWNLGNTFECYNSLINFKNQDKQITQCGNPIPTEKMIASIKKYGFKTIRLPVTWMNFMDSSDKVDSEWISMIKEVVKWITKSKMYCILNVHHDGESGNWLSEGLKAKNKYINLWSQIAKEFKDFNEYLIFESMNDGVYLKDNGQYDYLTLLEINQAFVDTIRNSGGKNSDRLLLIAGVWRNPESTCSPDYGIPIDPMNKFAICFNYYKPEEFCLEPDDEPWTYKDYQGQIQIISPLTKWGTREDYEYLINIFENIKNTFLEKGIPVIINEIGVLTEQKKEIKSIREYLFTEFSMTLAYDGVVSCLWDTSKKTIGNMNFYDRENDKWYDNKIKDFFINLTNGKYLNPTNYLFYSNKETSYSPNSGGGMFINIGKKKVIKIILNVIITTEHLWDVGFGIISFDKNGGWKSTSVSGSEGKRINDGSYTISMNTEDEDFNSSIQIEKWWGHEYIIFNYLTLEYDKEYIIFDYTGYKQAISSYIL